MKTVEIFDSDCEALETLSKVHGGDIKATISDLVNIGIKTYASQIAAWREEEVRPKMRRPPRPAKSKRKGGADVLYDQAVALAQTKGKISCAEIQRTLLVSYNTAAHLLDLLIDKGVVVQGTTKSSWVLRLLSEYEERGE